MKTDVFYLSDDTSKTEEILDKVELIAQYSGLGARDCRNVRLLAEEMYSSVDRITSSRNCETWVETDNGEFDIHVFVDLMVTPDERDKFLAVSRTGENTTPKGFLGKMSMMIDSLFSSGDLSACAVPDYGYEAVANAEFGVGTYCFSYHAYLDNAVIGGETAREADLEKMIIESIADDITVTVKSNSVHMVGKKKLK